MRGVSSAWAPMSRSFADARSGPSFALQVVAKPYVPITPHGVQSQRLTSSSHHTAHCWYRRDRYRGLCEALLSAVSNPSCPS